VVVEDVEQRLARRGVLELAGLLLHGDAGKRRRNGALRGHRLAGGNVGFRLLHLGGGDVEFELSHRSKRHQALIDRVSFFRLQQHGTCAGFLRALQRAIEHDQHVALVEMLADSCGDAVDAAPGGESKELCCCGGFQTSGAERVARRNFFYPPQRSEGKLRGRAPPD
jgi:hypothetical protein